MCYNKYRKKEREVNKMLNQIIGYICAGIIVGVLIFAEVVFFIWAHDMDKEFKEKYENKGGRKNG